VRYPFLRADQRDHFGERIEAQAEPPLHPSGDRVAILDQAQAEAVAMHRRLPRRRSQGLDCGRRRGEVRVSGSEVDHVYTARNEFALPTRDMRERVFGQGLEARGESGH
jgi:hypothetical protein